MLIEYKEENKYDIGSLKDYIYIIPEDSINIQYIVDNGAAEVISLISDTIYKINGTNVLLTEESSINSRFRFETTVSINLNEVFNDLFLSNIDKLINNRYYVVVENLNGEQFIQSVEFSSEFSYTYNIDSTEKASHYCTLSFKILQNIPCLVLSYNITETSTLITYNCNYNIGDVIFLKMNYYNNSYLNLRDNHYVNNVLSYNGDTFKEVEPIRNTFKFTEEYENGRYIDTIEFNIPLSYYKFNFHYALLEFVKNKYAICFKTFNGNIFCTGFQFGYLPTYTITTSEEHNDRNIITFTLRHTGNEGLKYSTKQWEVLYQHSDETIKVPVRFLEYCGQLDTLVCIDDTYAIHTVLQEATPSGELLDRYHVLDGYEDRYNFLNIVGTYTKDDSFDFPLVIRKESCIYEYQCNILKGLPISINFCKDIREYTYTVNSHCDWTITNIPSWLNVSPTNGIADRDTIVTIKTTTEPTKDGISEVIYLNSGTNTQQSTVTYIEDCSAAGLIYRWVVDGYQCGDDWEKGDIIEYDPNNPDTWICDGVDKYAKIEMKYSDDNGNTYKSYIPPKYIKGNLIESNSYDCGYELIEWRVVDNEFICE